MAEPRPPMALDRAKSINLRLLQAADIQCGRAKGPLPNIQDVRLIDAVEATAIAAQAGILRVRHDHVSRLFAWIAVNRDYGGKVSNGR